MPSHVPVLPREQLKQFLELTDPKEASKAKMIAIYKNKDEKKREPFMMPPQSMRERILSMSLFPNPYNKEMIKKESGSD